MEKLAKVINNDPFDRVDEVNLKIYQSFKRSNKKESRILSDILEIETSNVKNRHFPLSFPSSFPFNGKESQYTSTY